MQLRKHLIGLLLTAAILPRFLPGADQPLLNAVRDGDATAIAVLLKSGVDPSVRDGYGATALMYAAAFASLDCIRLLLDAGADVNAASNQGSTALMWSTADAAKVRLLLGRGADVNARTKDGGTALLSAAFRQNVEVLRLLIAAGADPRAEMFVFPGGGPKMGLSGIAYSTNTPDVRDFLAQAEINPHLEELTPFPGQAPLSSLLVIFSFSLHRQPAPSLAGGLAAILDLGANPNDAIRQLTRESSPLSRVALHGDVEAIRMLLNRGADPNGKGSRGMTPLMMAAASERPNPRGLRLLIEKGADIGARDDRGRTALDWALMQGETDATRFLREKGARQMAPPPAAPTPLSTPRTAADAIAIALSRLQPAGPGFHKKAGCISCHNESLPSIAVALAGSRGIPIDRQLAGHPARATLDMWAPSRENFLLGDCSIFGFLGNITYGLLGLAEEGVPHNSITDAVTSCLSSLQQPDGRWEGGDDRPPLSGRSPMLYTAMAIRGLKVYSPGGRRDDVAARIARAKAFLRTAMPDNTQEQSFKLLGLIWSGATAEEIAGEVKRLLSLQGKDGGWAQRSSMAADAYATGQALYALRASGLSAASSACRKGAAYLLRTQLEDGTWYMRSRAVGFQPYFESGFPHGTDQFISAAATSWAVIALAYTL